MYFRLRHTPMGGLSFGNQKAITWSRTATSEYFSSRRSWIAGASTQPVRRIRPPRGRHNAVFDERLRKKFMRFSPTTDGVWFKSSCSGSWHRDIESTGECDAVAISGVQFVRPLEVLQIWNFDKLLPHASSFCINWTEEISFSATFDNSVLAEVRNLCGHD